MAKRKGGFFQVNEPHEGQFEVRVACIFGRFENTLYNSVIIKR